MKLHELIKTNNWLSVQLTLIGLYPDQEKQIESYQNVYEKLLQTDAVESDIEIVLTWYDDLKKLLESLIKDFYFGELIAFQKLFAHQRDLKKSLQ